MRLFLDWFLLRMGNCVCVDKVGYEELRESVPGSLVSDHDFDLFYSLCKVETVGALSSALHPSHTQLFYVVISGQVVVHLSGPKAPNVCATTFYAGDMIHFFNASLIPNISISDHACMRNGNISMSLQFKGYTEKMGRVIGMDREAWEIFISTRLEYKKPLQSLLTLSITEFCANSKDLASMTEKQLEMLGPMMKIRLALKGGMVCFPFKQNQGLSKNYTSGGPTAALLSGTVLAVSSTQNIDALLDRLRKESPSSSVSGARPVGTRTPSMFARLLRTTPRVGVKSTPTSARGKEASVRSGSDKNSLNVSLSDSSQKASQGAAMYAGSLLGLDAFFIRHPEIATRKYVVTSGSAVLGYLPPVILDAFAEVDPRFLRVLGRNYHRNLLDSVKYAVPMLSGMEESSYQKLASRIRVRGIATGGVLYRRDEPGMYAYIVIHGSVAVTLAESGEQSDKNEKSGSACDSGKHSDSGKCRNTAGAAEKADGLSGRQDGGEAVDQILTWGNMCGDVSLVTCSPYFNTTTALEPTVTLAISKRALDDVYFENKTKVCEIRIRQAGRDVDLQYVVDHPRGIEAFKKFLISAMAVENLNFYIAVDRFESMCVTITRTYAEMRRIRQRIEKNNASIEQVHEAMLSHGGSRRYLGGLPGIITSPTAAAGDSVSTATLPVTSDEQANAAYMARLFAELDSRGPFAQAAHLPTIHSSPQAAGSYATDDDEDTDIGDTGTDAEFQEPVEHQVSTSTRDDAPLLPPLMHPPRSPAAPQGTAPTEYREENPIILEASQDQDETGSQLADLPLKPKPFRSDSSNTARGPGWGLSVTIAHTSDAARQGLNRLFTPLRRSSVSSGHNLSASVDSVEGRGISLDEVNRVNAAKLTDANKELHAKLGRRALKLRQSVIELREVARNMVETYIIDNAPNQVNISATTRLQVEHTYREWAHSSYGMHARQRHGSKVDLPSVAGPPSPQQSAGRHRAATAPAAFHPGHSAMDNGPSTTDSTAALDIPVNIDFTSLFTDAKAEVLRIMRQDHYQRWQRTPEFHAFIAAITGARPMPGPDKASRDKSCDDLNSNSVEYSGYYYGGNISPVPMISDHTRGDGPDSATVRSGFIGGLGGMFGGLGSSSKRDIRHHQRGGSLIDLEHESGAGAALQPNTNNSHISPPLSSPARSRRGTGFAAGAAAATTGTPGK